MIEAEKKIQDEITGAGVEEAVTNFFEGANLTEPGLYFNGDKQIEVVRDRKKKILSATATIDGVCRAVINRHYGDGWAYFRLQGDANADGKRDGVTYNKEPYETGTIDLYCGPGVDLSEKRLIHDQSERLKIASRLGIKLNVQPPHRDPIGGD